jgi:flagellum-specific ATP synthase
MSALDRLRRDVAFARGGLPMVRVSGHVGEVAPAVYRVSGLSRFVNLGETVTLRSDAGTHVGEVIRIDDAIVTVKPFEASATGGIGMEAFRSGALLLFPDASWKGRVINALGQPLDGLGPLACGERAVPVDGQPPTAMRRGRVTKAIRTSVRVVDIFTPLCAGQRIGIFAGSGVGKSTLLAMLSRARGFDTVVLALVGERGREVREFLEDTLGESRANVVAVVSTGDESAAMRRMAPKTAMTVAEHFRDLGESVLLIMDSVTRFAHAAREVALAAGEPAVARGYAPSVFTDLPRLLERAGPGTLGSGSITGIFAVLVDGDDHNDPVADSIRGTLDGHIVLDRAIADQGRYPAVNVLSSVSRLAEHAWGTEERALVLKLRAMIARYEDTSDLRLMGGYQAGQDPELDKAIAFVPKIYQSMIQRADAPSHDAFKELAAAMQAN